MNLPRYEVRTSSDQLTYLFVSEGPKGSIIKLVAYTYLADVEVWNLGFGDYDPLTGEIDDDVISDNGDGRKVLATVAFTLTEFFAVRPDSVVFFTGSNDRRTRMYNRAITNYWPDFSTQFLVRGVKADGARESFAMAQAYIGFLIQQAK
jgi:hypothetical protein